MAPVKRAVENNTTITEFTHCSAFPGWLAIYFGCGHSTVAEGMPAAVCQLCKNTRDLL